MNISVVMFTLLAAVVVIVIIVVVIVKKKGYNKKEQNDTEHYYESLPPPSTARPTKSAPGDFDKAEATVARDSAYEDLKCKDSGHNTGEYIEIELQQTEIHKMPSTSATQKDETTFN